MPWKSLTAMVCIAILVGIALIKEINGVTLALGISAITGIGGWAIGKTRKS